MTDENARKGTAMDWQSLLMASNQALLGNGLRMAQLGPDAGLMILQWTQEAALRQAEFGARSLQLAAQLLAPRPGGNAVVDALETTARLTELANEYRQGLADLQTRMVSDTEALGARIRAQR